MKYRIYLSLIAIAQWFVVEPVHAQGIKNSNKNLTKIGKQAGVNTDQDVGSLVGGIISSALSLVGVIFLVLMVYAGFLWMTAQGETEQINKAKKIITSSIIGLVVVLSAYAITTFVTTNFGSLG